MAELFRVQCPDYRSHPTTYGQCLAIVLGLEEDQAAQQPWACPYPHEIVPLGPSLGQILHAQPPTEHDIGSDSTPAAS